MPVSIYMDTMWYYPALQYRCWHVYGTTQYIWIPCATTLPSDTDVSTYMELRRIYGYYVVLPCPPIQMLAHIWNYTVYYTWIPCGTTLPSNTDVSTYMELHSTYIWILCGTTLPSNTDVSTYMELRRIYTDDKIIHIFITKSKYFR